MTDATVAAPAANVPEPQAADKVVVRDLDFYYGQSLALKKVTLSLRAHHVTAFIGPSGCGKSTLLRVLNRMYDLYPEQRATGELMLDGRNMLDRKVQYRGLLFFWTSQHGVVVQYVGCAPAWDEIVFDGEPAHRDFVAYYLRTGHVLAAAGCNQERKMGIIAEVLREEGACPLRHVRAQADKVNHAVAV